jgi:hypothetical protein
MAQTYTTIKLTTELVDHAREMGAVFNRSIGGQIEYWVRLGKAVEQVPGYTMERVQAALEGRFDAAQLSEEEQGYFDEMYGFALANIQTPGEKEFWENLNSQLQPGDI